MGTRFLFLTLLCYLATIASASNEHLQGVSVEESTEGPFVSVDFEPQEYFDKSECGIKIKANIRKSLKEKKIKFDDLKARQLRLRFSLRRGDNNTEEMMLDLKSSMETVSGKIESLANIAINQEEGQLALYLINRRGTHDYRTGNTLPHRSFKEYSVQEEGHLCDYDFQKVIHYVQMMVPSSNRKSYTSHQLAIYEKLKTHYTEPLPEPKELPKNLKKLLAKITSMPPFSSFGFHLTGIEKDPNVKVYSDLLAQWPNELPLWSYIKEHKDQRNLLFHNAYHYNKKMNNKAKLGNCYTALADERKRIEDSVPVEVEEERTQFSQGTCVNLSAKFYLEYTNHVFDEEELMDLASYDKLPFMDIHRVPPKFRIPLVFIQEGFRGHGSVGMPIEEMDDIAQNRDFHKLIIYDPLHKSERRIPISGKEYPYKAFRVSTRLNNIVGTPVFIFKPHFSDEMFEMEDLNVVNYAHSTPIVLTKEEAQVIENIAKGDPVDPVLDLNSKNRLFYFTLGKMRTESWHPNGKEIAAYIKSSAPTKEEFNQQFFIKTKVVIPASAMPLKDLDSYKDGIVEEIHEVVEDIPRSELKKGEKISVWRWRWMNGQSVLDSQGKAGEEQEHTLMDFATYDLYQKTKAVKSKDVLISDELEQEHFDMKKFFQIIQN